MSWRVLLTAVAALGFALADQCPSYATVNVNQKDGVSNWEDPVGVLVYEDVTITPCTKLRFSYDNRNDVWLMRDKAAYDSCCFEECGAVQVGSSLDGGGAVGYDDDGGGGGVAFEYAVTHADADTTLYFADFDNCAMLQKVAVHVADSITWNATFGGESMDVALAIDIAPADASVVVAGYTHGDLSLLGAGATNFPVGNADAWARKLSAVSGVDEWGLQEGTTAADRFTALRVSTSGDVFVTGYTLGAMYPGNQGEYDAFVAAYAGASGAYLWGVQCCSHGVDFAHTVAVWRNETVVIAGESSTSDHRLPFQGSGWGGDFIVFVRSYSARDGASRWNFTVETEEDAASYYNSQRDAFAQAVATDGAGDVIVALFSQARARV